MQSYEMMCVFDTRATGESATTETVEAVLKENGVTDLQREDIGIKRLAYAINKRNEGKYVLFRFSIDEQAVAIVRKELGIKEALLRFLIIRTGK